MAGLLIANTSQFLPHLDSNVSSTRFIGVSRTSSDQIWLFYSIILLHLNKSSHAAFIRSLQDLGFLLFFDLLLNDASANHHFRLNIKTFNLWARTSLIEHHQLWYHLLGMDHPYSHKHTKWANKMKKHTIFTWVDNMVTSTGLTLEHFHYV